MNVAVSIEHPAWAHQFRYIIEELERRGDHVTVLAVDKDRDLELLEKFGIKYIKLANSTGRNTLEKGWLFIKLCFSYIATCKKAKTDILIGRLSPMMSVAAFFLHRPHVIYDDSEVVFFSILLAKLFSTKIITPQCFYKDIGKKQIRARMYKELYYLSPDHFQPDKEVLRGAGIDPEENYVVIRFVAWKASHDFGMKGLRDEEKLAFVRKLSQYARVYISSEDPLTGELEPYRLNIAVDDVHHVLYYAQLVISDGATMASEAVVLGTHALCLCPIKCGTFIEQEERYHLLKWYPDATKEMFDEALVYATELLQDEKLWEKGKEKRKVLLEEAVDCNRFFIDVMDTCLNRKETK